MTVLLVFERKTEWERWKRPTGRKEMEKKREKHAFCNRGWQATW